MRQHLQPSGIIAKALIGHHPAGTWRFSRSGSRDLGFGDAADQPDTSAKRSKIARKFHAAASLSNVKNQYAALQHCFNRRNEIAG